MLVEFCKARTNRSLPGKARLEKSGLFIFHIFCFPNFWNFCIDKDCGVLQSICLFQTVIQEEATQKCPTWSEKSTKFLENSRNIVLGQKWEPCFFFG